MNGIIGEIVFFCRSKMKMYEVETFEYRLI